MVRVREVNGCISSEAGAAPSVERSEEDMRILPWVARHVGDTSLSLGWEEARHRRGERVRSCETGETPELQVFEPILQRGLRHGGWEFR